MIRSRRSDVRFHVRGMLLLDHRLVREHLAAVHGMIGVNSGGHSVAGAAGRSVRAQTTPRNGERLDGAERASAGRQAAGAADTGRSSPGTPPGHPQPQIGHSTRVRVGVHAKGRQDWTEDGQAIASRVMLLRARGRERGREGTLKDGTEQAPLAGKQTASKRPKQSKASKHQLHYFLKASRNVLPSCGAHIRCTSPFHSYARTLFLSQPHHRAPCRTAPRSQRKDSNAKSSIC